MSFDLLAPHYRWMEWLLAGPKLQRCRTAFIDEILEPKRVLLLGEGNGRCLAELAAKFPAAEFVCVDASQRMLDRARERLRQHGLGTTKVALIHADILEWQPRGEFDLIVTNFFLDCFRPEQINLIVSRIAANASPGVRWLLADFCEPESGFAKWRARAILTSMYLFFRVATGLPATKLTPPDEVLERCGFTLSSRRTFEWGLLHSDVWVATEQAKRHKSTLAGAGAVGHSLPARNEWGERRREGKAFGITSSPRPSPP